MAFHLLSAGFCKTQATAPCPAAQEGRGTLLSYRLPLRSAQPTPSTGDLMSRETYTWEPRPRGLKRAFLERAGARRAPGVLTEFVKWYLRLPGSRLPERPPAPASGKDSG